MQHVCGRSRSPRSSRGRTSWNRAAGINAVALFQLDLHQQCNKIKTWLSTWMCHVNPTMGLQNILFSELTENTSVSSKDLLNTHCRLNVTLCSQFAILLKGTEAGRLERNISTSLKSWTSPRNDTSCVAVWLMSTLSAPPWKTANRLKQKVCWRHCQGHFHHDTEHTLCSRAVCTSEELYIIVLNGGAAQH